MLCRNIYSKKRAEEEYGNDDSGGEGECLGSNMITERVENDRDVIPDVYMSYTSRMKKIVYPVRSRQKVSSLVDVSFVALQIK